MTVVKSDLQKLEALLKSATNERQRKMYQSLLDKALKEIGHQESVQLEDKRTDDFLTVSLAPSSGKPVKDRQKQKKKKKQKEQTIEQVLSKTDALDIETIEKAQNSDRLTDPEKVDQKSTKSEGKEQSKLSQPNIFQAIGLIKCIPQIKEDKLYVTIDDLDYELRRGAKWSHRHFDKLKEEIEQNGSREMWLRVYPNIIHDSKNQEIRYWFTLVKAFLSRTNCSEQGEDFVFRGTWRYVSYCCNPVISIHRNIDNIKFYQRLSFKAKKAFARPLDFPVVWSAPIEPFRYNRELVPKEQMPHYFVQVKAVFEDGRFKVVEMISEPTLDVPRYIKPPKNSTKSQK
ncbi:hypothetical protein I4641_19705 [Waterburya agarophytonicola K14]|uniref:Uncharacterized protein n=1 Tax=Waterburya agarophytonicola KI4 TaxID=2874699 RepID=A0A964BXS2_9CYAN|nr:hypothetical protein [Waterburya agarophytonicola]MCC0179195.1 hypothetical protein [Waterburya agarophytonicola KI4]